MRRIILIIIFICLFKYMVSSEEEKKENQKFKVKPYFSFYYKQKSTAAFGNDYSTAYLNLLNIKNELNFKISIPIKIYTLSFNFNNLNVVDFLPLSYSGYRIEIQDILYNSFVFSLQNKIKIKKVITFNIDFEAGINAPVYIDPYLSLFLNPVIDLEGDYYFGYFWEIEQSFPIDIYFDNFNSKNIIISNYAKSGFEFFRFYGPKKFKIGISVENTFRLYIPSGRDASLFYEKTFNDLLKAGIYLKFFNFIYSLYFINDISGSADYGTVEYQKYGFNTGLDFIKKIAVVSFDYSFIYNYSGDNISVIEHKFDFYVKFRF